MNLHAKSLEIFRNIFHPFQIFSFFFSVAKFRLLSTETAESIVIQCRNGRNKQVNAT